MEIAINIAELTKSFDDNKIIDSLNLDIKKGAITFLSAPTGTGKTTLLRIISGLDKDYVGNVSISSDKVGYVFQEKNYFPWLTVIDNIKFSLGLSKNINIQESSQFINELLKLSELSDKTDIFPKFLSGGQKQKMAICRSLVLKPSVLLLDEPFNGLDIQTKFNLFKFLRKIVDEYRITIFAVSHNIMDIAQLGDEVILFKQSPLNNFSRLKVTNETEKEIIEFYLK